MRDIMIKKKLSFFIPDFLDKDIDILIAAHNNPDQKLIDCELDNLYGSINMCQYGRCITKEQADELRDYYLHAGWLYVNYKEYVLDEDLVSYVRMVLTLQRRHFRIQEKKSFHTVLVDLDENDFKDIVSDRALCMKATEETGILHVTKKETKNDVFIQSLLLLSGKTSYKILEKN